MRVQLDFRHLAFFGVHRQGDMGIQRLRKIFADRRTFCPAYCFNASVGWYDESYRNFDLAHSAGDL